MPAELWYKLGLKCPHHLEYTLISDYYETNFIDSFHWLIFFILISHQLSHLGSIFIPQISFLLIAAWLMNSMITRMKYDSLSRVAIVFVNINVLTFLSAARLVRIYGVLFFFISSRICLNIEFHYLIVSNKRDELRFIDVISAVCSRDRSIAYACLRKLKIRSTDQPMTWDRWSGGSVSTRITFHLYGLRRSRNNPLVAMWGRPTCKGHRVNMKVVLFCCSYNHYM